jgi:protein phosphatase
MSGILYVVCGVSGAGKSTFIEKFLKTNSDVRVVSSDKMRGILFGDENIQSNPSLVFSILKKNVDDALKNGEKIMVDATNLNAKDRRNWVDIAKKYNAKLVAYVMERDRNTLIQRQEKRKGEGGRFVSTDVIDRMLNKYQRPSRGEGFDEIILI